MSISRSRLLSGIGLSLAFIAPGTALAGYWCHRNQRISNRILTKVKRNFAKEGTIETSWIELQPLTINDHHQHIQVYRGGIILRHSKMHQQIAFLALADGSLWRIKQQPITTA